jgi:hypothetical protein
MKTRVMRIASLWLVFLFTSSAYAEQLLVRPLTHAEFEKSIALLKPEYSTPSANEASNQMVEYHEKQSFFINIPQGEFKILPVRYGPVANAPDFSDSRCEIAILTATGSLVGRVITLGYGATPNLDAWKCEGFSFVMVSALEKNGMVSISVINTLTPPSGETQSTPVILSWPSSDKLPSTTKS